MTGRLGVLWGLGVLLIGCVEAPQSHSVAIARLAYAPETLVVAAGDTVTWVNDDLVPHTVTLGGETGDADVVGVGDSLRWVIGPGGGVRYWCRFHPGMKGTVIVR